MANTDRILISKDKYLHLGLCESRNHLPGIMMNELKPIEEMLKQNKQNLMAYIDDRIDHQDALKLLKNVANLYEGVYIINLGVKVKSSRAGLYKVSLSQYERHCESLKRLHFKRQMKKYADFHRQYNVKLTRTEHEIIIHMLKGSSISDVAEALECSSKVIYTHKYNIIRKYGFRTFNELYINILQQGHT